MASVRWREVGAVSAPSPLSPARALVWGFLLRPRRGGCGRGSGVVLWPNGACFNRGRQVRNQLVALLLVDHGAAGELQRGKLPGCEDFIDCGMSGIAETA